MGRKQMQPSTTSNRRVEALCLFHDIATTCLQVVTRTAAPAQRRNAVVIVRAEATEPVSRRAAIGAVAGGECVFLFE